MIVVLWDVLDFVWQHPGGPPNPEHMYTEAMLRDIYKHLDIQVCEEYIDTLNEGHGHSGKSALIDLVGIKTA